MSLSIDRANLPGSGAPKVTWNGGTFWTRDGVVPRFTMDLREQRSSIYGRITKTRGGRMVEINLPLFGLWENLSLLFPSSFLTPTIGGRIYGTSDLPLVLHAKNGDRLTIANARLTGLSNLRLAANEAIFAGNFKFTGLIANGASPADANSYYTYDNAAYSEAAFAMTNFKAQTWIGAWGAITGFDNILTEAGWGVDFELGLTPDVVDGIGPVDMFITEFWARASCIPVGPTFAQIEANQKFQDAGAEVGSGIDGNVADLVLTSGASTFTLKNAALVESGLDMTPAKKRIGETVWETTRGFTAGAPNAMAAAA